ncbi:MULTISPECIES: homocysteine S-methyltransferase [Streptomyces]|uniref:Homocysteine S-methyltransferase n=1 Tax=Streptomyces katrae TaxID=68223 RepID=A0ABT7GS80_9ACTN|nr:MULTISPECIES: homocysteine S-methyltransferase [Streptomyces]MDK9496466.1 homocysteine S-methyltransferase [Streptomyces katrae]RST05819.1 homocysteine S-methyltransferase [Streptomyces sp. WAC07149]GLX21312.1 homocysteine S-methyltransferase [Streptomyces lavendulae subsp. lavendulae]GLX27830.1 homocysteine S-methyltransferase [Streptomyces lavendulae subsp. lavendulae]
MPRATGPLAEALARRAVLLDGGLSNQLADQGCDLSGGMWTGRVLAERPGQVEAAHTAYVRAGAEVLITASYQVGHDPDLLERSVRVAGAAARAAAREVWVAASVGPYGALLADGSEYRGRYGLTEAELAAFHRPRIGALLAAGPDVLALETVPDVLEARALLRVLAGTGARAWLTYTVAGGRTRAGQPLAEAFALAAAAPEVIAVGVNCCDPADVLPALAAAASVTAKPLVAYPNDGSVWDAATGSWNAPAAPAPWPVEDWRAAGARLVGGCCRIGPDRIAALGPRLA